MFFTEIILAFSTFIFPYMWKTEDKVFYGNPIFLGINACL